MSYLDQHFPFDSTAHVSLFDELSLWSSHFGQVLLDNVPLRKGMTVLDVGCGLGFPLLEMAQRLGPTCRLTGIDPWETALDIARSKAQRLGLSNVLLHLGDAAKMPFPDREFDLIVSNVGVNNFDQPHAVMTECFRVLKRPGRICLTSNLQGTFNDFYSAYRQTLKDLDMADLLPALQDHEAHRSTDESIRDLLEGARFSVVKLQRSNFTLRFADGTAMFNHMLMRVGFLPAWRSILPPSREAEVFSHLEKKLNEQADWDGELRMTVPMVYVEAVS